VYGGAQQVQGTEGFLQVGTFFSTSMGEFDPLCDMCRRYYTGERVAPILTIVIGGNHEASNYMRELFHGGWLAPNIYYLGHAGCVSINGVRIAGASGIFKFHDFQLGKVQESGCLRLYIVSRVL